MSHSRTLTLSGLLISAVLGASLYLAPAPHKTANMPDTYVNNAVHRLAVTKDDMRKSWQRFDLNNKLKTLQFEARPIRRKLKASVTPETVPGAKAATWGERNMSIPAILLILTFGGIFVFMSAASPESRLGGRH